jgi:RNA polymerase sigma-70 factor (ECF subfamily)
LRIEESKEKPNEDIYALVEKIKEGDREAFMEVTRRYQNKVFLLAFSFFQNREDALDIVQETFLRLYQKIDMYQKERNFQNWLLQIAKNLCIDLYRKSHSKYKGLEREKSTGEMNLAFQTNDDFHESSDLKVILSRCLKKLGERQRMIFVMKHYNHLEYTEIAQILDISLGTVKSLHFKAVRNLRGLIAPFLGRKE